jgi:hypothetical protein
VIETTLPSEFAHESGLCPDSCANPRRVAAVRWGRVVVVGVLLAGVLFGATLLSVRFVGGAPVTFAGDSDVVTLPRFGDRGAHVLAYHHGEQLDFSFPIENAGRLPLTLETIRMSDEARSMLQVERVTVDGRPLPLQLDAGASAAVRVTARYTNCRYYHEREVEVFRSAIVGSTVLGMAMTRQAAFDYDLVLHSPMIVGCPDRTLDRNDDRR